MFKTMLADSLRVAAKSAGEILTGELVEGAENLARDAVSFMKTQNPWAKKRATLLPLLTAAIGMGISLGAAAMYLLDPDQGAARRSQLRERLTADAQEGLKLVNKLVRAGAMRDEQLAQSVRTVVEQVSSNASAIKVQARRGHVILHGELPKDEVERVLTCVASVRGVVGVCNDLHGDAEAAPQTPPESVVH